MINQAVKRIVLYPMVPIITFIFNIISNLLFFTTKENHFEFQMLANVGTGSQGLLNALAFCFDPAMRKIWREIFYNILKINYDNKDVNNDNDKDKDNDNDDDDDKGRQSIISNTTGNISKVKYEIKTLNQSNTTTTLYCDDNLDNNFVLSVQIEGIEEIEGKEGKEGMEETDDNNIISLL